MSCGLGAVARTLTADRGPGAGADAASLDDTGREHRQHEDPMA